MRSLSLFTVAAALPAVLAGTVTVCVQTGCPTYSTVCKTSYGLTSVVCPTSTITLSDTSTITVVGTATTTKMITVTPSPSLCSTTEYTTETVTTVLPTITDTISVTTTLTTTTDTTSIVPVTTTTTMYSSTTVTTTTTTTPAGFMPLTDTYAAGSQPVLKKVEEERALAPRGTKPAAGIAAIINGNAFPTEVICEVQVYIYETRLIAETTSIDMTTTVWATAMTTTEVDVTETAAQATLTTTYYSTVTTTITQGPPHLNATTTLSETSTVTSTVTSSSTTTASTATTMTFTATSTANGACQTNNVLNTFQYQGATVVPDNVFNNGATEDSNYVSVTATDQFDCCNQCSNAGGCTGSTYLPNGMCLLLTYADGAPHVCIQSQNIFDISYHTQVDQYDTGFYISNGLCGEGNLGTDDDATSGN